jgi:hypothetical protein
MSSGKTAERLRQKVERSRDALAREALFAEEKRRDAQTQLVERIFANGIQVAEDAAENGFLWATAFEIGGDGISYGVEYDAGRPTASVRPGSVFERAKAKFEAEGFRVEFESEWSSDCDGMNGGYTHQLNLFWGQS